MQKTVAQQDLASRGLSTSTLLSSAMRSIEQDAVDDIREMHRDFNAAIEQLHFCMAGEELSLIQFFKHLAQKLYGIRYGAKELISSPE